MPTLLKARKLAASAPREALIDAIGFAAVCALIFVGFTLPAFM
ncbi:MAG: hypothetical protein OEN23_13770 [Paracoccaceae bacterium]|nr:hypothetical protein [Paracoccaceae bacterium]